MSVLSLYSFSCVTRQSAAKPGGDELWPLVLASLLSNFLLQTLPLFEGFRGLGAKDAVGSVSFVTSVERDNSDCVSLSTGVFCWWI